MNGTCPSGGCSCGSDKAIDAPYRSQGCLVHAMSVCGPLNGSDLPTQHSLLCNMIFPLLRRNTPCPPRHVLAPSCSLRALLLSSKNGNHKADRLAASISQALKDAGLNEGRSVKPSDMLRFGMGLGITLGANGLLGELGGGGETGAAVGGAGGGNSGRSRGWQGESIEITGGAEASLAPPVVKVGIEFETVMAQGERGFKFACTGGSVCSSGWLWSKH